jgi:hypothetical protein
MSSVARVTGPGWGRRVARWSLLACVALIVTLAAVVSLAFTDIREPDDIDLGVFDPDEPYGL